MLNSQSVAFWIYPTSAAAEQIILSADESTKHGPYLSVVPSGGNLRVKGVAYYGDGRGDVSITSNASMTLNAWHLIVWGYDQAEASDFTTTSLTGRVMYVQVDSGARDKVGLAYFPIIGPYNDLLLGQRRGTAAGYTLPFSGRVDELTFAGRTWDSLDVIEFYATGTGKPYPFTTTAYLSLNDGLVAYWKMDEAVSSGTRYDSINQNNAADPTTVAYAGGKIGLAAYDDAITDRLSVASSSQIEYSGDFAVGGWAYVTSWADSSGVVLMGKTNVSTSKAEWEIRALGSGNAGLLVANSAGWYSTYCLASQTRPSLDAWHFWIAEYTASTKTCTIRVDNGTVYSGTGATNPAVQSDIGISFGTDFSGTSNGVIGYFDEWFMYKRVLTPQEETDLYNVSVGRTYPF